MARRFAQRERDERRLDPRAFERLDLARSAQAVADRHEEEVGEQRAVQRREQRHRHRAADRLRVGHLREHAGQPDQRADHAHRRRGLGGCGPDVGGGDVAFDATLALDAQQAFDLARDRAVDDRGDRDGDVGIGDHRPVERDDAVALGDARLRCDLFEQRIGAERPTRQDAQCRECATDIAERRAQHGGGERAAADDGESDRVEELCEHARLRCKARASLTVLAVQGL